MACDHEVTKRIVDPRSSLLVIVPDRGAPTSRPEAVELMALAGAAPCSVLLVR